MSGFELSRFKSSNGSHNLTFYAWEPDNSPPKGVIQILHGMREYMGRYDDFASFCVKQGFAVYGHDHIGHGRTAGESKDGYGYFGDKNGEETMLSDCAAASRIIARKNPGVPLFLLGHSMGSFLGRLLVVRLPGLFSGFICMGTGGEQTIAPAARAIFEIVTRVRGGKNTTEVLNRIVVSPSHIRYGGMDWLSRDINIGKAFSEDPMSKPVFTNRALCDLISLQMAATSKKWAGTVDKSLPILLTSGGSDVIGGNGAGVIQTYERLKLAGCMDVELKLYDNAKHEILNEINKEEVYYDLCFWVSNHLTQ